LLKQYFSGKKEIAIFSLEMTLYHLFAANLPNNAKKIAADNSQSLNTYLSAKM